MKLTCLLLCYTTNIDHKKWKIHFCLITKRKPYEKFIKDSNFYFSLLLLLQEPKVLEDQSIKEFQERTNGKWNALIPCYWCREIEAAEFKGPASVHTRSLWQNRKLYPFPESETRVSPTRPAFFPVDTFPLSPESWLCLSEQNYIFTVLLLQLLCMKQDNHVLEEGSYCLMKSIAELLVILVMLYHTLNTTKQILLHNV